MSIGNRIKEERERLGYSQEAFAAIGDVSKRSQIAYEKDDTEAGARYFTLIANIGADISYILTGERTISHVKEPHASYAIKRVEDNEEDDLLSSINKLIDKRVKPLEQQIAELKSEMNHSHA